ncbi:peptidase M20 [Oceanithermus profundus DSM 14977]|uniref:Peptidase M20 n=1 Tax=Oceanithermus profundus (strain DSM 14977 / NBRC 100410 / VKM B-2274 / 506) TaxID=670487 RepID=E4U8D8_OCEP5|nr:dipeptidase [Oceanithermus profundus]ADR36618.1 peptidase M20 [Oceanithermus profundus DSM 14977]
MIDPLNQLLEFLAIPSVSADPSHKQDVERAAHWLDNRLSEAGFAVEVVPTTGHPIVYAEKQVDASAPTVLVYGHYDVQPPDPLELWETPPFEPTIKDGKIYARGASDDKGQVFAHVAAAMQLADDLPVNLKFLIEGEEEVGSPNLVPFVKEHRRRLAADVVLISDSPMFAPGLPTLTYGLRGLAYLEVRLRGLARDVHSGAYGGAVPNAAHAAAWMIAQLKDPMGWIRIPGFYDDVVPVAPEERAMWARLPFDEEAFKAEVGAEATPGEPGYGILERRWARPTLDVNGLGSGYQGEGSKTVIPAEAFFKFSMRLVPDQDPEKIADLAEAYLREILPEGYAMEVIRHHGGDPVVVPTNSPPMQAAAQALEEAWGRETVFTREGGSIPIVADFMRELEAPVVLMGFGLESDNLHAPNEKFDAVNFEKGIEASKNFLRLLPMYLKGGSA